MDGTQNQSADDAHHRLRSTALDPSIETFQCDCGKPNCAFRSLYPFREHIARLYRAIASCDAEQALPGGAWQIVLYPLQMAASLEDVQADTSYVDDTQSTLYCSSAAEYESAKSEIARRYVAGLTVFSFLWTAYEAAFDVTRREHLRKLSKEGRNGERGRRLFEELPSDFPQLAPLRNIAKLAEFLCERGNLFDNRLQRIRAKYPQRNMVFAAELCREFRNFIYHGQDRSPDHEDWHHGRARGESVARVRRFYAVGRLLLLLIQALAYAEVSNDADEIAWGLDEDYEPLMSPPKRVLESLHLP